MIDQLKNRIKEANEAYRIGKPVMSDSEYDILIEELAEMSPEDEKDVSKVIMSLL